jgi:DNA-binding protein H-NS
MISTSMLDELKDDELRVVIEESQGLLKRRDEGRKAKAIENARTLLASVGLSLKDINGKSRGKSAKAPAYKGGHHYQHPTNKTLMWNAKGQKPNWLRELEAAGGKAVEIAGLPANDNAAATVKKTG